jgi:hypothetical protein
VPSAILGVREPFDHPSWFTVVVPLHGLALLALGYAGARHAWRWPFLVAGAQLAGVVVASGFDPGNLFPLTIVLFGFLGFVGLVPTYVGVALRRIVTRQDEAKAAAAERAREFAETGTPPGSSGTSAPSG